MAESVLIVDNDPLQRRLLENIVGKAGYETASVDGGEAALKAMLATPGTSYDCVVLDLAMPDLDGLGVLGRMRKAGLKIPVIVQTTHGDNVIAAIQAGAFDFVVRPVGFERLSVSLRNAVAARMLVSEIARLNRSRRSSPGFDSTAGDRRIPARMHSTLAPTDDVGVQQICESTRDRTAIEVPLFLDDDGSPEHFSRHGAPAGGSALNLLNNDGNVRSLEDIEVDVIRFALQHYRGQMSEVARRLRIGRSTLYRKLGGSGLGDAKRHEYVSCLAVTLATKIR